MSQASDAETVAGELAREAVQDVQRALWMQPAAVRKPKSYRTLRPHMHVRLGRLTGFFT